MLSPCDNAKNAYAKALELSGGDFGDDSVSTAETTVVDSCEDTEDTKLWFTKMQDLYSR